MTAAQLDDPGVYDADRISIQLSYRGSMELKTARLTLLIDPNKKAAFERLCAQQDLTSSQVVRQLIRDYLAHHGVSYQPSGQVAEPDEEAAGGDAVELSKASVAAEARGTSRRRRPKD
jgi:hypothetical protein